MYKCTTMKTKRYSGLSAAAVLAVSLACFAGCGGRGDGRAVQQAAAVHAPQQTAESSAQVTAGVLPDSAGFALDRAEHDFGTVARGDTVSVTFQVRAGSQPVVVLSAVTDCGCTWAEYPKQPLLPDETGLVKVFFAARDKGNFYKTVRLRLNSGGRGCSEALTVRGMVE